MVCYQAQHDYEYRPRMTTPTLSIMAVHRLAQIALTFVDGGGKKARVQKSGRGKYLRSPIGSNLQQLVCNEGPCLQRPFHHRQGSIVSFCHGQGRGGASPWTACPLLMVLGNCFEMGVVSRGQLGFRLTFLQLWQTLFSCKHAIHAKARCTTVDIPCYSTHAEN